MRKPLANSPTVPIQSSMFRIDFISCTLPLVNAFKPFSKFAFTGTPLAAHFENRQLFVPGHTHHSVRRYVQHFSRLPESHKAQRINVVFHRGS